MPLTASGEKVMHEMTEQYGEEKGKEVFYASINAKKKGSKKWHKKRKKDQNYGGKTVSVARKLRE